MKNKFIQILISGLLLAVSLNPVMAGDDAGTPGELTVRAEYLLSSGQLERARQAAEEALRGTVATVGLADIRVADLYHLIGQIDYASGDYERSSRFARMALGMREDILGPDHGTLAESLGLLAEIYERLNMDEKAEALHKSELEIRARMCSLPAEPPFVAQARF